MTSKKTWLYGIIILILGGGTYLGVKQRQESESTQPSQEKLAAAVQPNLSITTSGAKNLTLTLGSNIVDVFFMGQPASANERNMSDASWIALNKSLGFSRYAYPCVGATSNYTHIDFTRGKGYNMKQSDFASEQDYRTWGNGVAVAAWTKDFASGANQFKNLCGAIGDVCLNMRTGTWSEYKSEIQTFNPEYIHLGAESVTTDMTEDQYYSKAVATRDSIKKYFTGKKIVIDCGLVYKGNKKTLSWNKKVAPLTANNYGRFYIQVNDIENFNRNQDSNIIKISDYFDTQLPSFINSYKTTFPNSLISVGEYQMEDNRGDTQYVNGTMAFIYGEGRLYESLIKNQDMIAVAYQMTLRNLVGTTPESALAQKTIKLLNTLVKPSKTITTLTITGMNGVTGLSEKDGSATTLLLNNKSTSTYTPTLTIDGATKTSTYTLQRMYAKDWYSSVSSDSITSNTITILPNSISVINFK